MRVAKMPYLQLVKGKYRVRMVVPPELQPIIGKANLTKWLGTGNEPEANRLSVPWIAKFQDRIDKAAGRTTVFEELRRLDMLGMPKSSSKPRRFSRSSISRSTDGFTTSQASRAGSRKPSRSYSLLSSKNGLLTRTRRSEVNRTKPQRPNALPLGLVTMTWRR